ncbi:YlxR family protein [Bacillus carboniphilus]|uniref:YlxR family protein n=1 Tax=Bacillus carboniphilus TaxID=86663 RepID=A0ABY9JVT2_9BACI|nr:YlxR family protein [Bacillus carboniphilus]WLR43506.1 YlxR family protein [Bacillus carboniphilus]
MKQKKIPLRKCLITGEMKPKKELIRVVRSKEGEVSIDPTGKKNGRGAYLTLDAQIIEQAKKKNILSSQLNAEVSESIYEQLINLANQKNGHS